MEYNKSVQLRFCDCDYKKRAKLSTILANLTDIAGLAYTSKGYSHEWLWENEFVFLVSRSSLHINRMPKADEIITVETWERDVKGSLFYRDFVITDENNLPVIEASTAWILANPNTRQILRPSSFTGKVDIQPEHFAKVQKIARLKIADDKLNFIDNRKIVYSDIDANGHLYNAFYADIAFDFLPIELTQNELVDFQINFKKEAKLGELMQIYSNVEGNIAYIVGKLDAVNSFECVLTFA